ncbi:MAG TPA: PilZ domain-containing protein [Sphingomicrobium sp.]|nr:PilZ domain-containing protein [Sphingomicrobium sp.]
MGSFGKAKGGGRRKAARAGAPVLGTLSTVGSDYRCGLVNLSSNGGPMSAPYLPGIGEEVIFHADKLQSFGRVVWAHDGECGVQFEAPVLAGKVQRLRRQGELWSLAGTSAAGAAAEERPSVIMH